MPNLMFSKSRFSSHSIKNVIVERVVQILPKLDCLVKLIIITVAWTKCDCPLYFYTVKIYEKWGTLVHDFSIIFYFDRIIHFSVYFHYECHGQIFRLKDFYIMKCFMRGCRVILQNSLMKYLILLGLISHM